MNNHPALVELERATRTWLSDEFEPALAHGIDSARAVAAQLFERAWTESDQTSPSHPRWIIGLLVDRLSPREERAGLSIRRRMPRLDDPEFEALSSSEKAAAILREIGQGRMPIDTQAESLARNGVTAPLSWASKTLAGTGRGDLRGDDERLRELVEEAIAAGAPGADDEVELEPPENAPSGPQPLPIEICANRIFYAASIVRLCRRICSRSGFFARLEASNELGALWREVETRGRFESSYERGRRQAEHLERARLARKGPSDEEFREALIEALDEMGVTRLNSISDLASRVAAWLDEPGQNRRESFPGLGAAKKRGLRERIGNVFASKEEIVGAIGRGRQRG